jgi:hypothetical protein
MSIGLCERTISAVGIRLPTRAVALKIPPSTCAHAEIRAGGSRELVLNSIPRCRASEGFHPIWWPAGPWQDSPEDTVQATDSIGPTSMTNAAPWTCAEGFQHRLSWSSPHCLSSTTASSPSNKLHRLRLSPRSIPIVSDRPAGPFGVLFGLLLTSVTLLPGRSPSCTLSAQLWAASRIRLPPPVFPSHLHWHPLASVPVRRATRATLFSSFRVCTPALMLACDPLGLSDQVVAGVKCVA